MTAGISYSFLALLMCSLCSGERLNAVNSGVGGAAVRGGVPRRSLLIAPHPVRFNNRLSDSFIIQDDDVIELTKKQFDDYGHLRFGKREDQFDDYGHLRFGRSDTD